MSACLQLELQRRIQRQGLFVVVLLILPLFIFRISVCDSWTAYAEGRHPNPQPGQYITHASAKWKVGSLPLRSGCFCEFVFEPLSLILLFVLTFYFSNKQNKKRFAMVWN